MMYFYSLFFTLVFLGCAHQNSSKISFTQTNCTSDALKTVNDEMLAADMKLSMCFKQNKRADDLKKFEAIIFQKTIAITCEADPKSDFVARASSPSENNFPAIKINTARFQNKDEYSPILVDTLIHESLHWLGYTHYTSFELPYLAEICCGSGSDNNKENQKAACAMINLRNNEWTNPGYIKKLSSVITRWGLSEVAVKTAFYAAYYAYEHGATKNQVFDILSSPLEEINRYCIKNPKEYCEEYRNLESIPIGIVFGSIVNPKSDHNRILTTALYNAENDRIKILFFQGLADILKSLIFNDQQDLETSAKKIQGSLRTICPLLTKSELTAARILMSLKPKATFAKEMILNPPDEIPYSLGAMCTTP